MQGPLPVKQYHSTLRLRSITDENHSYAEWLSDFDVAAEMETKIVGLIGDVLTSASDSAKKWFDST